MDNEFRMSIGGVDKFIKSLEAKALEIDRVNKQIVERSGAIVQRNARRAFRPRPGGSAKTSKSGRKYYDSRGYGVDGFGFDGSFAPINGQPTQRSGNLQASIQYETRKMATMTYGVTIGPTMKYGRAVELGSPRWKTGNKFPYMRPGYEASKEELSHMYRQAWARVLG